MKLWILKWQFAVTKEQDIFRFTYLKEVKAGNLKYGQSLIGAINARMSSVSPINGPALIIYRVLWFRLIEQVWTVGLAQTNQRTCPWRPYDGVMHDYGPCFFSHSCTRYSSIGQPNPRRTKKRSQEWTASYRIHSQQLLWGISKGSRMGQVGMYKITVLPHYQSFWLL